eukprot:TRINITY_DN18795_c0_g1_i1.p1 TRINITY_DN18795_c0_g1~~TRINITY_DN18795_c0_g1_i1.p1  ORF type:complete len:189 (+),score=17.48 TRINITY_DN18795_c0_g1_i1:32-598(+)
MLMQISYLCIRGLQFCHSRGVVHGSISSGCLLMSTFTDIDADRLVLKLDNFGFSKRYDTMQLQIMDDLSIQDSPFQLGCHQDRQALGFILMELYFSSLVSEQQFQQGTTTYSALQRLLIDVFKSNFQDFRQYCVADAELKAVVDFLDLFDGQGWKVLEELILHKTIDLLKLLESPFLDMRQLDTKTEK